MALDIFALYEELHISNISKSQVFGGGGQPFSSFFFSSLSCMEYLGFVTQDIFRHESRELHTSTYFLNVSRLTIFQQSPLHQGTLAP